jgi:hypothetical protein
MQTSRRAQLFTDAGLATCVLENIDAEQLQDEAQVLATVVSIAVGTDSLDIIDSIRRNN